MSGVVSQRSSSEDWFHHGQPRCTFITHNLARDLGSSNREDSRRPSLNGVLNHNGDAHQRLSQDSAEPCISEGRAVENNERYINNLDENDSLSLEVNCALTKGQNRRYERQNNKVFCIRRNNETGIVDQFMERMNAKNQDYFAPAVPEDNGFKKSDFSFRNVHGKRYRNIAERAQFRDSKELGEILIFEEQKTRRCLSFNRDSKRRDLCRCVLGTPIKRAIGMASQGVVSDSGWDISPGKKYSLATNGASTGNCDSSVELEFKLKAGCDESVGKGKSEKLLSDVLISGGARETTSDSHVHGKEALNGLFLRNCDRNRSDTPTTTGFLGIIPLAGHRKKDVSLSFSINDHLPSISVKCGTSSGQILTVVRKTVTGLEIERRSSTDITGYPSISRSCDTNFCMEYDPPRVKKRTINWVKSQRLLQGRVKV